MPEVEIVPKAHWRNITNVTASAGPTPPAGTAIVELDGPHGLTDNDSVWVSGIGGISGINQSLEQPITVLSPTSIALDDATSISGTYTGGGIFRDASQNTHRRDSSEKRARLIGGALWYNPRYQPSNSRASDLGEALQARWYKSTDNAATWQLQDPLTQVALSNSADVGPVEDGTGIWVAYIRGGGSSGGLPVFFPRLRLFDTTTGTWGAETPDGPTSTISLSPCFTAVLPDGRIFVYYLHNEPGNAVGPSVPRHGRPTWAIWDPVGGSWDTFDNFFSKLNNSVINATAGSPPSVQTATAHTYRTGDRIDVRFIGGMSGMSGTFPINVTGLSTFELVGAVGTGTYTSGGATHYQNDHRLVGMCPGSGGRIHLFYSGPYSTPPSAYAPVAVYQRTFDGTSATLSGDEQEITADALGFFSPIGVPLSYSVGGATKLAVLATHSFDDGGGGALDKLQLFTADDALNPSWSAEDVSASDLPPENAQFCWGDLVYEPFTGSIWAFWTALDQSPQKTRIVYNSRTLAGSWGSNVTWKTDSEYWYANPAPSYLGGTELKIVYDKVHPNEIGSLESMLLEMERFPHIDTLSLCPPAGAGGRYAYFFPTR